MKFSILIFILGFFLVGCASKKIEQHPSGLDVSEIEPNKWTSITKQNLLHLAQVYDLSPFLYTKKVNIQSKVIPHSHPVLTLNTRNAEYPKKILATFLHEELHWWLTKNHAQTELAIKELQKIYPKVPVINENGTYSTHLHLLVCYLELQVLDFYLGKKEARGLITNTMKKDKIYPWVYYQVLYKDFAIKKLITKYKLLPPPLTLPKK
jgi:hypothetical protein